MADKSFEDMVERVEKLLAKAQSTEFPDEAKSLSDKATEIMKAWSIQDSHLRSGDRQSGREVPVKLVVKIPKPYPQPKVLLLNAIAMNFDVKMTFSSSMSMNSNYDFVLSYLFGFQSDVEMVHMLFLSLELQAANEMTVMEQYRDTSWGSTRGWRRSFLDGFAERVFLRFDELREKVIEDSEPGTALVLVNKEEKITEHFDELKRARSVELENSGFSRHGHESGHEAGRRADIGQSRVTTGVSGELA